MKKLLISLGVTTTMVFLGIIGTSSVKGQEVIPLVVAPARQALSSDAGKTASFSLRYYNTSPTPLSGNFNVADFIVSDKEGTPNFLEGPTAISERYSAAKWVSLNTSKATIAGGGMVTVNGTVKIPVNANPGGKYFAIFFEPDAYTPSETEGKDVSSVTMRVAGLVYLKVNGAISENASVIRFTSPGFSEYGPVTITTEIKNNGDYHITPVGQIVVKNMLGKQITLADLPEVNVFPDASRISTVDVGKKWMLGKYTATLNASYGEGAKALASTLVFWVFPWKLATIIILGIIIIILIIVILTNKVTKKQKKLEAELIEEKKEIEELKQRYEDKPADSTPIAPKEEEKKP